MACAATLLIASASLTTEAVAQTTKVNTAFSTHDYNSRIPQAGEAEGLGAVWADVKTPGDGRTYSVGTVVVRTTEASQGSSFSDRSGLLAPTNPYYPMWPNGFTPPTVGASRQIVILQCSGTSASPGSAPNPDQDILWQHYWYGDSIDPAQVVAPGPWVRRANNARAISVWPVQGEDGMPDREQTRVAICGETYDMLMEGNQFDGTEGWDAIMSTNNTSNPLAQNGLPNGFIAVFNGAGDFLWSYQFYLEDTAREGCCAITDVSIRVAETEEGLRDVVTYCGISSFGATPDAYDADHTLAPRAPFLAPTPIYGSYVCAGGDSDNGVGQWDGIVGRLSNTHSNPSPLATVCEFHSIVGGSEQDGLWGIAELDENRFVVVGGTAIENAGSPKGAPVFPFSWCTNDLDDPQAVDDYCLGLVAEFDASTVSAGNLTLLRSASIGNVGGVRTHARDVAAVFESTTVDRYVVVGATDDPGLFSSLATNPYPATRPVNGTFTAGVVNGFLATYINSAPFPDFRAGSFQDNRGSCGVAAWSEHPDHITVLGNGYGGDVQLTTYFRDTPTTAFADDLLLHREDSITSTAGAESPVGYGTIHANLPSRGLRYQQWTLEGPNYVQGGGGIAIDQTGRVNVVGGTLGGHLQIPAPTTTRARPYTVFLGIQSNNCFRSVVDMLPYDSGSPATGQGYVGRTDGTGSPTSVASQFPLAGYTGDTTPFCGLAPFGRRIGEPEPELLRMNIDIEGTVAPNNVISILVDRPPLDAWVSIAALQVGVPNITPPVILPSGMEVYMTNAPQTYVAPWVAGQSLRFNLSNLPNASSFEMTAQLVTLLVTGVTAGTPGACSGTSTSFEAASPALWVKW